jgi:hypothetical protein
MRANDRVTALVDFIGSFCDSGFELKASILSCLYVFNSYDLSTSAVSPDILITIPESEKTIILIVKNKRLVSSNISYQPAVDSQLE